MSRVVAAALTVALCSCATQDDARPLTLPYVTESVLIPSCGASECHSSMTRAKGYAFDTVDAARASLVGNRLINFDDVDPNDSELFSAITGQLKPRMPYDAPMLDADVAYIQNWIVAGVPGAQCAKPGASFCDTSRDAVFTCGDDYNLGAVVQICAKGSQTCVVDHCQKNP